MQTTTELKLESVGTAVTIGDGLMTTRGPCTMSTAQGAKELVWWEEVRSTGRMFRKVMVLILPFHLELVKSLCNHTVHRVLLA